MLFINKYSLTIDLIIDCKDNNINTQAQINHLSITTNQAFVNIIDTQVMFGHSFKDMAIYKKLIDDLHPLWWCKTKLIVVNFLIQDNIAKADIGSLSHRII